MTPPAWSRGALLLASVVHLVFALYAFALFFYVWGGWSHPEVPPGMMCFDCTHPPWWEFPVAWQLTAAANGLIAAVLVAGTVQLWRRPPRPVTGSLVVAVGAMFALQVYESAMLLLHYDDLQPWPPLVFGAWLAWLVARWRRAGATPPS